MPRLEKTFVQSPDYVQSLARGLLVLRSFDVDHANQSVAEIAARSGISRAATRRLVLTLRHLGYVREEGRGYALTPRVLELGFGYLGTLDLTDLVQSSLESLAHKINQSCSMAVLDAQSIVYIARVPVRRVMTVALGIGARLPAFAASMGRVLLSGLSDADLSTWLEQCEPVKLTSHTVTDPRKLKRIIEDARAQGFAYVEQELEIGLCSLAVPVHNQAGRVAAALNVSLPYHVGVAREAVKSMLPQLRETAKAIERCVAAHRLAAVSL
jgi:IclR family transcriptional regulator, pca regulon regulatory protein